MSIEIGQAPERALVHLTGGSDFQAAFYLEDGSPWPAGTVLTLEFTDNRGATTVWTANESGTDMLFDIDTGMVDAIKKGSAVKIRYVNGASDLVLGLGVVVRHD